MSSTTRDKSAEPCPVIIHYTNNEPVQIQKLKEVIQDGSTSQKIQAMKEIILRTMHGESLLQLLVPIIRFVAPSKDHMIKKLMLLYLEVVDKYDDQGNLYEQMILACNHLLKNLNAPNEYVKGSTLRFLCKLKDREMLGHLIEAILGNLNDKHAYVRRNAILAIYSICKDLPEMIPDAIDMIFDRLEKESDPSCKRNSLIMLFNLDRNAAIGYLDHILGEVHLMGEVIQLIVIEIIRKVVKYRPPNTRNYIICIQNLLKSQSPAVQYEASQTLLSLSSASTVVVAAASTFINLLVRESDQNVKMIVLDHIIALKKQHPKILRKLVMDILRALASPNMAIRKKTLDVALQLVSPRNINEIVALLKKEIIKTQSVSFENREVYKQLLVQSIHQCAVKFSNVAGEVIFVLMDYMEEDSDASLKIILFVREVVQSYEELRAPVISKLLDSLSSISSVDVMMRALWIISEYSQSLSDIKAAYKVIEEAIGAEPPFEDDEEEVTETTEQVAQKGSTKPALLPDGSYATNTKYSTHNVNIKSKKRRMFDILFTGNSFLAAVLSSTLTKLTLKLVGLESEEEVKNSFHAKTLLYLVSILRLGSQPPNTLDHDSAERITMCINALINPDDFDMEIFSDLSKKSLEYYLNEKKVVKEETINPDERLVDSSLKFKQLQGRKQSAIELPDLDFTDVSSLFSTKQSSQLRNITQLTGYSDPLYAEVQLTVNEYDILLDISVMNQTQDTLQNLSLELSTRGDLKLVDRPQTYSIGPYEKLSIRTSVKVSSTETGVIFGCITYDIAGSLITEKSVVLNNISIDIIDYIAPEVISDNTFRKMWADVEWENIVVVNTEKRVLKEYIDHIVECTHMSCLNNVDGLNDLGFVNANLYGKSIFGEHALANISIEIANGQIEGFIRIRSDKEGVAMSLGEKISKSQR